MKYKTTAKSIREGYSKKLAISYCGMQYLLWGRSPVAYTCGVYGWNFDVYVVDGIAICTGYRGMPGDHVDYELLREYETAAEKIHKDYSRTYEDKIEQTEKLLHAFLAEAAG